jgi:hypothetical protein
MDKLLEDIASVDWWLGVVAVGIAINVFSSALYSFIPKIVDFFRTQRSLDKEFEKFEREKMLSYFMEHEDARIMAMFKAVYEKLLALMTLVAAVAAVLLILAAESKMPTPHLIVLIAIYAVMVFIAKFLDSHSLRIMRLAEKAEESSPLNHERLIDEFYERFSADHDLNNSHNSAGQADS